MSLKRFFAAVAIAASVGASASAAWPQRPVRLIVPFGAGGITDIVARQVGQGMSEALGQSVVVENRPGAGGVIAAQTAAAAPPDGYTVFMGTVGTQIVFPLLSNKLSYDPDASFKPVGMVSGSPYVLAVKADVPVASYQELIAHAKANPGTLNFGSAGNASSPHLGLELLKLTAGVDIVHIPFKSGGEAVTAAVGGQVDVVMDASPVVMPHVASGKLKALAVAAQDRLPSAPDVPTSREVGNEALQISSWNAFFVPADTPDDVVSALNYALRRTLAQEALRSQLANQGTRLYTGTWEEYRTFIAAEKTKWAETIKRANIRVE